MTLTSKYQTYATRGFTHQVGDDKRATGGVHLHQARKVGGKVIVRIVESNGRFQSTTKGTPATPEQLLVIERSKE